MTDISITAANVLPGSGAVIQTGTAGEALTAGQALYQKAADNKWYKADCNSATAEVRVAKAFALTGSAAGQPVVVQTSRPDHHRRHHDGSRLLPVRHSRRHPPRG
jgi:DNA transposition AAA+ family ATPase